MKAFCILSTASLTGGSSKSFVQYCLEINKKNGMELVVSVPCKGPAYDTLTENNITTEIIPVRFNIYPKLSWRKFLIYPLIILHNHIVNKRQEKLLSNRVKVHNPDIIYTNVGVVNIGYNVAKKLHIPHIYHLREYQDLDFGMKIMPSRLSYIKCLQKSHNICITKGIQKHFKLNDDNSVVIYNGIENLPQKKKDYIRKKYFLFVGRLSEAKGTHLILKAFKSFCKRNDDYRLLLAGEPNTTEYKQELVDFCKESNIESRVEFLGARNDIDHLMQNAYAVIVASEFEAFGRVTPEAMYNECLVLGRNTSGTKEQFDNGVELTGEEIGIRFYDGCDLTKKMLYAISLSPTEYKQITERARYTVEKLYTTKGCANAIYEYFNNVIEENKKENA